MGILCYKYLFTGTMSWRDKKTGSWFIQELTEVFKTHGQTERWYDIRIKINKSISEKNGESEGKVAVMMSNGAMDTLTKKLYFKPGKPYSSS